LVHFRTSLLATAVLVSVTSCLYPSIPARYTHGTTDAGTVVTDGSPAQAGRVLNGCTSAMFTDRTAPSASRTVSFGGANGSDEFAFAPACVTIAAGHTVSFQGPFYLHPLSPGTGPSTTGNGSPNNPIPRTAAGEALEVRFPAPGLYPFYCEMHRASGMAGVVWVR
jgi:plastocyanin